MKPATSRLLPTFRFLLSLFWYFNIVISAVAFCVLTWKIATNDYMEFTSPVKYPLNPTTINCQAASPSVDNITLQPDQATIKMHVKNTIGHVATYYFFFFAYVLLVITIIYQLRALFNTIHNKTPFIYDNIRRLKITAACFALFTVLKILMGISSGIILRSNIKNPDLMHMVWEQSFIGLILGVAIYIIADVFKYGFTLQKENEEFV